MTRSKIESSIVEYLRDGDLNDRLTALDAGASDKVSLYITLYILSLALLRSIVLLKPTFIT